MVDCWMIFLARINPLSVEIHTCQIAPVVSIYDTIDVEHRHNFNDEILTECLGDIRVSNQEIYNVFDKVGCHCLARVDSRS